VKSVFVDTGYLIALDASDDQHHRAARAHWNKFSAALPPLVTTSYVFDEVVTLMRW
jgi:predicted nucleic acid-binding protein